MFATLSVSKRKPKEVQTASRKMCRADKINTGALPRRKVPGQHAGLSVMAGQDDV